MDDEGERATRQTAHLFASLPSPKERKEGEGLFKGPGLLNVSTRAAGPWTRVWCSALGEAAIWLPGVMVLLPCHVQEIWQD